MKNRKASAALLFAFISAACGSRNEGAVRTDVAATCASALTLHFTPDAPIGDEAYVCFGFDPGPARAQALIGLTWNPPRGGGVALHHAKLYALSDDYPDGPVACDGMPPHAVGIHVWAPGASALVLPDGVGLAFPASTTRLVVEAHAIRTAQGDAQEATAALCFAAGTPANVAAWFATDAPVPAIRPHHEETSTAQCRIPGSVHAWVAWPHMHRVGKEFHSAVIRGSARSPLTDVAPWSFDEQRTYALDVDLAEGDVIETSCVWQNDGDTYVLPGPLSSDEMCNQGLIGWPASSADCADL